MKTTLYKALHAADEVVVDNIEVKDVKFAFIPPYIPPADQPFDLTKVDEVLLEMADEEDLIFKDQTIEINDEGVAFNVQIDSLDRLIGFQPGEEDKCAIKFIMVKKSPITLDLVEPASEDLSKPEKSLSAFGFAGDLEKKTPLIVTTLCLDDGKRWDAVSNHSNIIAVDHTGDPHAAFRGALINAGYCKADDK